MNKTILFTFSQPKSYYNLSTEEITTINGEWTDFFKLAGFVNFTFKTNEYGCGNVIIDGVKININYKKDYISLDHSSPHSHRIKTKAQPRYGKAQKVHELGAKFHSIVNCEKDYIKSREESEDSRDRNIDMWVAIFKALPDNVRTLVHIDNKRVLDLISASTLAIGIDNKTVNSVKINFNLKTKLADYGNADVNVNVSLNFDNADNTFKPNTSANVSVTHIGNRIIDDMDSTTAAMKMVGDTLQSMGECARTVISTATRIFAENGIAYSNTVDAINS